MESRICLLVLLSVAVTASAFSVSRNNASSTEAKLKTFIQADIPVLCNTSALKYDIYMFMDTSGSMTPNHFINVKQIASNLIANFQINENFAQVGLMGISGAIDQVYTAFHLGQNSKFILTAINNLSQQMTYGQRLTVALQMLEKSYISQYPQNNKILIYFTSNTEYNSNAATMTRNLYQKYGLNTIAVRMDSNTELSPLQLLTGGSNCVLSATNTNEKFDVPKAIEAMMCSNTFCFKKNN